MLQEYRKVYDMLEDDESRDIYLNRLSYLISGDYKYIKNIVTRYLPQLPPLDERTMRDLQNLLPEGRKLVLYGAGSQGKELLPFWEKDERFIGFCSGTKKKQAEGYLGYPVMSPEELLRRRDLSVIISTTRARDEIMQILREGNYPEDQIFTLRGYVGETDPGQYFAPDFMTYENDEVFVDAGCCDLNSALELKKYCRHVKRAYAFEPDPENYKVCQERKERTAYKEAELLPFGTWSERKKLSFLAMGFGNSAVSEEGSISVTAVPIDEVIDPSDKVTMIKMDVEGAELESLKGAKQTIMRDRPKLAICIYHKPEDMTEIPLYIKELVPEYKLYIRHHSNMRYETVLYAIMP